MNWLHRRLPRQLHRLHGLCARLRAARHERPSAKPRPSIFSFTVRLAEQAHRLEGPHQAEADAILRLAVGDVRPPKNTLPSFGFWKPERTLTKVVLPAPLGPIRPSISARPDACRRS